MIAIARTTCAPTKAFFVGTHREGGPCPIQDTCLPCLLNFVGEIGWVANDHLGAGGDTLGGHANSHTALIHDLDVVQVPLVVQHVKTAVNGRQSRERLTAQNEPAAVPSVRLVLSPPVHQTAHARGGSDRVRQLPRMVHA